MTTPSGDDPADVDEPEPATPLWKETPFLAGLVVLALVAAVVAVLVVADDGQDPEIGLPEPVTTPTLAPEPTPDPSPSPERTPTPSPVAEPVDPAPPPLPEEDAENDVARGDEPDAVESTGQASGRTRVIEHEGGLAVIRLGHAGDGGFRARVTGEFGEPLDQLDDEEVLTDTEGRYAGSRAMVLDEGRYRVQIVADGVWGVRWVQPRYERAPGLPVTVSGSADLASRPFTVSGSHFDIRWELDGDDVAVRVINVVGRVSARLTAEDGEATRVDGLGGGLYVLDVRAAEPWRAELREAS